MTRAPLLVGALGWVLVAAGSTVFWVADQPGDAGWTAYSGSYQPLPAGDEAYRSELVLGLDGAVLWTGTHLLGAGLLVLGLLVLAGLAGWLFGRRAGTPRVP
ncbi:hypothetical protein E4P40_06805 [Blastococcus sp. CT_GayMR20]|uniref:hypothetical protein n=1 Tax=Blastococcus sp. CT_GayMR20 TaxID=2559609 RepID=UPI001073BE78|nr:hypothetical protein [Blastococcus sp. CT_GayMR20]TFV90838.1 hypothetical protein E4P40_06760 [Blastococcus sp. CT_GayMR20]TFV90843.1 hypothetical protein E4P40_06805 [Blastococcus sp. CT_GayMR20]